MDLDDGEFPPGNFALYDLEIYDDEEEKNFEKRDDVEKEKFSDLITEEGGEGLGGAVMRPPRVHRREE